MISLFFQETFPIKLFFCGYKPSIKILKLKLEINTFCKCHAIVNRGLENYHYSPSAAMCLEFCTLLRN